MFSLISNKQKLEIKIDDARSQKDWDKVFKLLQKYNKINPDSALLLRTLADHELDNQELIKAREYLEKATAMQSYSEELFMLNGKLEYLSNNFEKALQHLKIDQELVEYANIFSSRTVYVYSEAYKYRGLCQEKLHQYNEAVDSYVKLIKVAMRPRDHLMKSFVEAILDDLPQIVSRCITSAQTTQKMIEKRCFDQVSSLVQEESFIDAKILLQLLLKLYPNTADESTEILYNQILEKENLTNRNANLLAVKSSSFIDQQIEEHMKYKKDFNKEQAEIFFARARASLNEEKLGDARCLLQLSLELAPEITVTKADEIANLQNQIQKREQMTEEDIQMNIKMKTSEVRDAISHAEQQVSGAKSDEERRMIERQTAVLQQFEANLVEQQKKLEERAAILTQQEKRIDKQKKQIVDLLAELADLKATDRDELHQQMEHLQSGDKDVDAARLKFESLQKQVQRAHQALRIEEQRQRERSEWLLKQIELYRVKGMTPDQLVFRNYLKDVKRLSFYRSKVEHTQHPLRCFISYAWETDDESNKVLQKRLQRLKDDLQTAGMKVTLDIRNMSDDINKFMVKGIKKSHKVLLICTPRLKVRASDTTRNNLQLELNTALERSKKVSKFIVPIIMSGAFKDSVPSQVTHLLAINFVPSVPKKSPQPTATINKVSAHLQLSTTQISMTADISPSSPSSSSCSSSSSSSAPSQLEIIPPPLSLPLSDYYQAMATIAPQGLIPILMGLDDNKDYQRIQDRLFSELRDYDQQLK